MSQDVGKGAHKCSYGLHIFILYNSMYNSCGASHIGHLTKKNSYAQTIQIRTQYYNICISIMYLNNCPILTRGERTVSFLSENKDMAKRRERE